MTTDNRPQGAGVQEGAGISGKTPLACAYARAQVGQSSEKSRTPLHPLHPDLFSAQPTGAPYERISAARHDRHSVPESRQDQGHSARLQGHSRGERRDVRPGRLDQGGQKGEVSIPVDPASALGKVKDRRAAFAAWEAAGSPWPPPAGLTSACLDAAMVRPGKPQPKWGRR